MRTTVSTLSFAQLLCSAIAQEWTVSAYTGLQCNGEQLSHHEPFQQPAEDRECRLFDDFVATSSVVFAISEDTDDTWVFGLHESPEDNSCIFDPEGAGAYTLQPGDNNVCIQLQEGESTFHVQKLTARKALPTEESAVSVRPPYEVSKRQFVDGWGLLYAEGGTVTNQLGGAVRACAEAIQGDATAIAQCGLYAISSILFAMAAVRQFRGLQQEAARLNRPGAPANMLLSEYPDHFASQVGLDEGVKVFDDLYDDHTITVTRLPSLESRSDDTVDTYLHLSVQDVNSRTGEVVNALLDMDTLTNASTASSVPRSPANGADKQRRQEIDIEDYTAYYSWDGWDLDDPTPQEAAHDGIMIDILNYMLDEDTSTFCMAFTQPDFNGLPQPVNFGYFAYISGTFTDRKTSCE